MISIKLLCHFIEITLQHRFSPINLLHNFRTPFPNNTSEVLLLLIPNPTVISSYKIWLLFEISISIFGGLDAGGLSNYYKLFIIITKLIGKERLLREVIRFSGRIACFY